MLLELWSTYHVHWNKVFGIFDSLVAPVATYACEFWLPYLISKSGLTSRDIMLSSWESLKCETINQKCARMILSVHNKASRLAVLGELGRYQLFIPALSKCINYKLSLEKIDPSPKLLIFFGQKWQTWPSMDKIVGYPELIRSAICWISQLTLNLAPTQVKQSPNFLETDLRFFGLRK